MKFICVSYIPYIQGLKVIFKIILGMKQTFLVYKFSLRDTQKDSDSGLGMVSLGCLGFTRLPPYSKSELSSNVPLPYSDMDSQNVPGLRVKGNKEPRSQVDGGLYTWRDCKIKKSLFQTSEL